MHHIFHGMGFYIEYQKKSHCDYNVHIATKVT